MIRKIKLYFKRRKFRKRCLFIPCTSCPFFIDDGKDGKCHVAIELGLEEL